MGLHGYDAWKTTPPADQTPVLDDGPLCADCEDAGHVVLEERGRFGTAYQFQRACDCPAGVAWAAAEPDFT